MKIAIIADHRHALKKPYAGGLAMVTHKIVQKLSEQGIQVDVYKNERALVNWDVDGVDDYAYIVKMNDDE